VDEDASEEKIEILFCQLMRFSKGGLTYQDLNNMPLTKAYNLSKIAGDILINEDRKQKQADDAAKARQQYMGR
jgi:hypothetical protein